MANVNLNDSLWAYLREEFPSPKYHPDLVKFLAIASAILDTKYGTATTLWTPEIGKAATNVIALINKSIGDKSIIASELGYHIQAHGVLSPSVRVQTIVVDDDNIHQKNYGEKILVPMMKVILGLASLASNEVAYPLVYESLAATRSYFGYGLPWDRDKTRLLGFTKFVEHRFNYLEAENDRDQIWQTEKANENSAALRQLFDLLITKKYVKSAGAGKYELTAGAVKWLDTYGERLLRAKAFVGLFYAFDAFTHVGKFHLSPNKRIVPLPVSVKDVRKGDIMECVNAHPVMIPLLGWDKDFSSDPSILGALAGQEVLRTVTYGDFEYLCMHSGVVVTPKRARVSGDAMAMQELALMFAIMSGTDMTRSIEFLGSFPTQIRENFASAKAPTFDVAEVPIVSSKTSLTDLLKLANYNGDLKEFIFKGLINPNHTAKGAVHTLMSRGQGLKFYSYDNLTNEKGNVVEWTIRHGIYVSAWSQEYEKGLAPSSGSPSGGMSLFEEVLIRHASDDGLPAAYRALAGAWTKAKPEQRKIADFLGSMPIIGDVTILCKTEDSILPAFSDEYYITIDFPFPSPAPMVVRLKGLGDYGYNVTIFVASPNAGRREVRV